MDICSGIDICGDVSACVCAFVAAGVGTFISCIDLTGVNCAAACCEGIIDGTSETLGSQFNMPAGASAARTGDDSMVAAVAPVALACRYIGDGSMIADDHSVIVVVDPDTSPSSSSSGHACNKSCAGSAGVGADVGAAVAL